MYTTSGTLLAAITDRADRSSWSEFYSRYAPLIFTIARRQGLSQDDAEEVVQLVMMAVTKGIERYDPSRGSFRSWLLAVSYNKVRDVIAARSRAPTPDDDAARDRSKAADGTLSSVWEREWSRALLREAAETVRRERGDDTAFRAFWLTAVQGLAPREAAEALGVKVDRVYEFKHRIGQRVARRYEELRRAAEDGSDTKGLAS
ncbi:MAG: RNA polymerase sigma factor [Phycisphaerales bacterium]